MNRDTLEQAPCDDAISRQAAIEAVKKNTFRLKFAEEQGYEGYVVWSAKAVYSDVIEGALLELPPVNPQEPKTDTWSIKGVADALERHGLLEQEPKTGYCKDCKYFEYDSVARVDGIPLIVAHELCKRWGDGCKTKEDGYCFLYEPQERSE